MSTVINTNVLALNAHRNLGNISGSQEKASQRLSSGLRINSAADDAAGLAISEKMRAQIRGLDMATKNAQDAQSLIQTAEGGMQEIDNMVQRIRELTVQASNDTNEHNDAGTGDRQKIQDEINALVTEIDSMADRTEFNKKKLINGEFGATPEVRTAEATVTQSTKDFTAAKAAFVQAWDSSSFTSLKDTLLGAYVGAESADKAAASTQIDNILTAFNSIKNATTADEVTAAIGNMDTAKAALASVTAPAADSSGITNLTALFGASAALDNIPLKAAATAVTTAKDDLVTAKAAYPDNSLYFQVGANANQKLEISIQSVKSDRLGIGDGSGGTSINVLEATGADITATLDVLDNALSMVTTERSKLGAAQNRLDYTMKSLQISSENLSAAESRIRDTDMAKEMMNYTKSNVLQQAATSMLAQANQAPQMVLKLLG